MTLAGLSPRSRLYHQQIAGLGTGAVESMTSYVMRLATAHRLFVGCLINHYLGPLLVRARTTRRGAVTERMRNSYEANGLDVEARAWVAAVGEATLRTGLRTTSMLPWASALPPRRVISPLTRHCPRCLADMAESGLIYEPLAWHLVPSVVCPTHHLRLRGACFRCGSTQSAMTRTSRPGMCQACDRWLGAAKTEVSDRSFSAWDQFTSDAVYDLLAHPPEHDVSPSRVTTGIRMAIDALELNAAALVRQSGIGAGGLSTTLSGKTRPSLDAILRVCAVGGWAPSALLQGDLRVVFEPVRNIPRGRSSSPIDWAHVESVLRTAIEAPRPAKSLKAVATEVAIRPSSLRQKLPDLARAITTRHEHEVRAASQRRIAEATAIVVEVTRQLLAEGASASRREVEARLPAPLLLREPALQDAWRATRLE